MSTWASKRLSKDSSLSSSSRSLPLNDSTKAFCQGAPGSIYEVVKLLNRHQSRRAAEISSGPLSQRMDLGVTPLFYTSSSMTETVRSASMLRAATQARA